MEAPVRNLQVVKEKVIFFFLSLIGTAPAAGSWEPLLVSGIQPLNLRNTSSAGLWEPRTQDCFTSSNRSSGPSFLPGAQHQIHVPGLPPWGGEQHSDLGGSNSFSFWHQQSFCYLCNCFPSFNLLLLILKRVPPF